MMFDFGIVSVRKIPTVTGISMMSVGYKIPEPCIFEIMRQDFADRQGIWQGMHVVNVKFRNDI
jgi:hypothetical protein